LADSYGISFYEAEIIKHD